MTSESPNFFNQNMAARLAGRIEKYWRDRGYTVTVWTERVAGMRDAGEGYCVRSDLLDGKPRG